jgi:hypothetical protein
MKPTRHVLHSYFVLVIAAMLIAPSTVMAQ